MDLGGLFLHAQYQMDIGTTYVFEFERQIRMTKSLLPLLRKAQGRIVNVSSICGRLAFGGAPWYSCTRGVAWCPSEQTKDAKT